MMLPINPEKINNDENYEKQIIRQLDEAIDNGDIDEDTACRLLEEWTETETIESIEAQIDIAASYAKAIENRMAFVQNGYKYEIDDDL